MKELSISKMTWNDISVQSYLTIQKSIQQYTDAFEQMRNIIICLTGKDINDMNVSDAMQMMDDTNTLLQTPFVASKDFKKLTVGNFKCRVCDLSSMTLSQFMDYQELTKDPNDNLVELLSLSIVPEGCKYNDGTYDIDALKDAIKDAPITMVSGVINFQLAKLKSQYRSSLAYLTAQIWLSKGKDKEEKKIMKKCLQMVYKSMGF